MIILFSKMDPTVAIIAGIALLLIVTGLFLKKMSQPYIIGYIIVGALFGSSGFDIINDVDSIHHLGELGIILLLFFIGMEISLPELVKQWKLAAIGTTLQILVSVFVVLGIGYWFNWRIERSIILGFVIALSSSAVIIKIIQDKNLINSNLGKSILTILLTQDIVIVPLLIITSLLGGEPEPIANVVLMVLGGIILIGVLIYIYRKKSIQIPFSKKIEQDHELQVFLAIFLCFGGALIASIFGLSAALGAFVGGMIIHSAKATDWIYQTLHSFRVIFVALFFASVGLQIDLSFIAKNYQTIGVVLLAVYFTNHLINAIILKLFKSTWVEAMVGGAYLAQIGELSFLLSSSAYYLNIIGEFEYLFTISLISLTLIISPFYISTTELLAKKAFKRA